MIDTERQRLWSTNCRSSQRIKYNPKKWIKVHTKDYMIYSTNGRQISCPQITRILNKIFGKNISTSMLRHIYLTNVYKNVPKINQMQDLANEMGHSVSTALEYIKR